MYITLFTHPAGFAGRLDRDDNLGISLSAVLSAVKGCHPEGVNPLTPRIQRLCVLNVTLETERKKKRKKNETKNKRETEIDCVSHQQHAYVIESPEQMKIIDKAPHAAQTH